MEMLTPTCQPVAPTRAWFLRSKKWPLSNSKRSTNHGNARSRQKGPVSSNPSPSNQKGPATLSGGTGPGPVFVPMPQPLSNAPLRASHHLRQWSRLLPANAMATATIRLPDAPIPEIRALRTALSPAVTNSAVSGRRGNTDNAAAPRFDQAKEQTRLRPKSKPATNERSRQPTRPYFWGVLRIVVSPHTAQSKSS